MSGLVSLKPFVPNLRYCAARLKLAALRVLQAIRLRDLLPPVVNHVYYKVSITKGVASSYVSYGDLLL